jgi:hypothetical protein
MSESLQRDDFPLHLGDEFSFGTKIVTISRGLSPMAVYELTARETLQLLR